MNFRKLSASFVAAILGLAAALAARAEETIRIGWLSSLLNRSSDRANHRCAR